MTRLTITDLQRVFMALRGESLGARFDVHREECG
jgi:hypothetical protein